MDPLLHFRVKLTVSWVNSSRWNLSKVTKDANISRQLIDFLEKGRIIHSKYTVLLVHLKEEIAKIQLQIKKIKVPFHQDNVPSQVNRKNGKTTWISLWIASISTLFSKSGPQQLLTVCRPQKNAPWKEIWLQWRSDIGNWGVFWGKRQIALQKKGIKLLVKCWNQCITLEGDCWWIKLNFAL